MEKCEKTSVVGDQEQETKNASGITTMSRELEVSSLVQLAVTFLNSTPEPLSHDIERAIETLKKARSLAVRSKRDGRPIPVELDAFLHGSPSIIMPATCR